MSKKLGSRILGLLKAASSQPDMGLYNHVVLSQFGRLHDIEKLSEMLRERFVLVKTLLPDRTNIPSIMSELRGAVPEILFKADTLFAAVAPGRAVLFQKERKPFTEKDLELRKTILELYPFRINLPFFAKESKFETQAEEVQVSDKSKEKARKKKKEE